MTGRICYITRSDRGGRLVRVRLVGERSDESFSPIAGRAGDLAAPGAEVEAAADWIADRLSQGSGEASLRLLCVDLDGAVCSWLTAPSAEPDVVAAALVQREDAGAWGGEEGGVSRSTALTPAVSAAEASVQALAERPNGSGRGLLARRETRSETAVGRRLAVLAVPDVLARLLIDALDERGIEVGGAVTLWHALSLAWDAPGAAGVRAERVVATNAPVTATTLIDPAGRLVWSWSREGELLAGGTLRLTVDHPAPAERREGALARAVEDEPAGLPRLGQPEVARLTTDWLAWSAQLGVAPTRIRCIGPEVEAEGENFGPAELGSALGAAWAGATVDLATDDDPVGTTLAKLARGDGAPHDPAEDARAGLVSLSRRPGRAHRSLYRWAAAAVLAGATALGVVAWKAWEAADEATSRAEALRAQTDGMIAEAVPRLANDLMRRKKFEDELRALRQRKTSAQGVRPAKPILEELETVSYVLAGSGAHITEMSLRDSSVHITVTVPDIRTGEVLRESLNSIGGSHVTWKGDFPGGGRGPAGERLTFTLDGAWTTPTPKPPAPGTGGPA